MFGILKLLFISLRAMSKLLPYIILAVVGFFLLNRKATANVSTYVPAVNASSSSQSTESINANTLLLQQQVTANNIKVKQAAAKAASINKTYVPPPKGTPAALIQPLYDVANKALTEVYASYANADMTNPYVAQSFQKAIESTKKMYYI